MYGGLRFILFWVPFILVPGALTIALIALVLSRTGTAGVAMQTKVLANAVTAMCVCMVLCWALAIWSVQARLAQTIRLRLRCCAHCGHAYGREVDGRACDRCGRVLDRAALAGALRRLIAFHGVYWVVKPDRVADARAQGMLVYPCKRRAHGR